ncbi:MAG: DEAD/DEAH box helicase [Gammaproteobacteria bacterium]
MTENAFFSADQKNLLEVYLQRLSPEQQSIVQLLSLTFYGCSRTSLGLCLQKLKIAGPHDKPFTPKLLAPYLIEPLRSGLIVELTYPYQGRIGCNPIFVEIATRLTIKEGRFGAMADAVLKMLNIPAPNERYIYEADKALCGARICFYRGDFKQLHSYFAALRPWARNPVVPDEIEFYRQIVFNPYEAEWFAKIPNDLQGLIPAFIQRLALIDLQPPDGAALALLHDYCRKTGFQEDNNACMALLELLLALGEWDAAGDYLSQPQTPEMLAALAWLQFLRGDNTAALETYQAAFTLLKKKTGKRKVYFEHLAGVFWPIALIKAGTPEAVQQAEECLNFAQTLTNRWHQKLYALLQQFIKVLRGDLHEPDRIMALPIDTDAQPLGSFFVAVVQHWTMADGKKAVGDKLQALHKRAQQSGYRWISAELANMLLALGGARAGDDCREEVKSFFDAGRHSLLEAYKPRQRWEMALEALANLNPSPTPAQQAAKIAGKTSRLAWWLHFVNGKLTVEPKEQVLNAKGVWSKGRAIALKRLKDDSGKLDFLTPQDIAACAHIHSTFEGGWGNVYYTFKPQVALTLAGHPLLFWADNPDVRVELASGDPELRVEKQKNAQLKIGLSPQPESEQQKIHVSKESPTRLKVVEFKPEHRKILDIVGKHGLEVPAKAQDKVLQAIAAITPLLTVHSDIGGGVENVTEVPADHTLRVHLLPCGEGLKASLLLRPFGEAGPYYRPGSGGATVLAEIEGQRLQTRRDLRSEKKLAQQLLENCPTLAEAAEDGGEYLLETPEQCLEFLLELEAVKEQVRVEWPEGQKFRLAGQADLAQFRLQIRKDRDWFSLEGEVQLNEEQVFDMRQLLDLLAQSKGRFVQLQDGQFLALTEAFRKRLEELRAYGEQHGKGLRMHPLAALALGDMDSNVARFKADKHWQDHLQRLRAAQDYRPQLPSTFQAELRDYQRDGFQWLARLAHWGVGGCLADDMGLGKTLQALAAILTYAPQGPSLVIAPTSVCMNWESEAARFTPTLNVKFFGGSDRQKLLDNLQPFDLLICSYGLLQQEHVAEALAKVHFQSIVLDEAQAIKNIATRRSQAAMNLQAEFKLITTGTPVENHLGELWNLFRFINPGLLGSLERFNQRFAGPIERNQDKNARQQLRKLIQPFILRRTKNQVLQELPPRTEIVIHVDLSAEETAFYEALRREALEKIAAIKEPGGSKHLQILAEIMKLRRACCNTQLVAPDAALPSSKLETFGEIIDELLDNKHKALVFSQFVDHLQLLQAYLNSKSVAYQYLDGSTPAKERKQRVDAFQRGEGELFLISLKAGGVGLNLTAADYVLHMDPWWNPAVEDQASDRAHRIGQQRPVTIYRFVARNTIEEKIVALHAQKRDLADSLLEGADISGKMSADELLALMREE